MIMQKMYSKGRWTEGENILLEGKNPEWLYKYAKEVLKGRWPEGENIILECKDSGWIYWYAKEI